MSEKSRRIESILDGTPFPVAVVDLDMEKVLYWSRSLTELTGHTASTVEEWRLRAYPDPEIRADGIRRWKPCVEEARRTGRTVNAGEYPITCADGRRIVCEIHVGVVEDALVVTLNDVTERKKVEDELRRREGMLQKVFEMLPVGLWFADEKGTLLRGNPAGVRIWGAEPKVPIEEYGVFRAWRLPGREEIGPEDWALVKTIREGATIIDELLEIEAFDGVRRKILNYTTPLFDDGGTVEGAVIINLDVTDRLELEERLGQATKLESVGRLAGGVAHDFNNMLNVIIGNAEIALEEVDASSHLRESLEEILQAANHSADLTKQLLTFARKQTVSPVLLYLNRKVEVTLKLLRRLIGENIQLHWCPGKDVGEVFIDPMQLEQLLTNLCVNAGDAIGRDRPGSVWIQTDSVELDEQAVASDPECSSGPYVRIRVRDDGPGMDEVTRTKVFEPFFTTKEVGDGTGLGLATVYGIVRQNGGFVVVDSEVGKGTSFLIHLPRIFAET